MCPSGHEGPPTGQEVLSLLPEGLGGKKDASGERSSKALPLNTTNPPDHRRYVNRPGRAGAPRGRDRDLSSPCACRQGSHCPGPPPPGARNSPGAEAEAGGGRSGEMKTASDCSGPRGALPPLARGFLQNVHFLFQSVCGLSPSAPCGLRSPLPRPSRGNPTAPPPVSSELR